LSPHSTSLGRSVSCCFLRKPFAPTAIPLHATTIPPPSRSSSSLRGSSLLWSQWLELLHQPITGPHHNHSAVLVPDPLGRFCTGCAEMAAALTLPRRPPLSANTTHTPDSQPAPNTLSCHHSHSLALAFVIQLKQFYYHQANGSATLLLPYYRMYHILYICHAFQEPREALF
jgi:hypothetical protein